VPIRPRLPRAASSHLPQAERDVGARLRRRYNIGCAPRRVTPHFLYWAIIRDPINGCAEDTSCHARDRRRARDAPAGRRCPRHRLRRGAQRTARTVPRAAPRRRAGVRRTGPRAPRRPPTAPGSAIRAAGGAPLRARRCTGRRPAGVTGPGHGAAAHRCRGRGWRLPSRRGPESGYSLAAAAVRDARGGTPAAAPGVAHRGQGPPLTAGVP
jgi:hypothetical protein